MRIYEPSFEIWLQEPGLDGVYRQVERAGRVCYKSEDHCTAESARPFVERMIKSDHTAMLEHATVYLTYGDNADGQVPDGQGEAAQPVVELAGLPEGRLRALPDEAVIATLLPLPGIGRWTVEMYLIFALGRADVFAVDDLALAEGARLLFDLPERPKRKEFNRMAEAWSPWRAVAARGLWAFYAACKQREGVAP